MINKDYPKIYIEQTDTPLPEPIPLGHSKYNNFKNLREGGIASIKTCTDICLGRTVAMKSLLPSARDIITEQKRFIREARVTSLLQHPNTPSVYEIGKDESGDLFFTMKYLQGKSLKFILNCLARSDKASEKEFNLKRLLSILTKIIYGVAYAHEHGVIHRDLKPGNIQIGAFREVLVLDWGIAKVWDAPNEDDIVNQISRQGKGLDLTQMGPQPGTPLYMSPEQIRGDVIDERTDIYSLGAILYEILTLKNIFKANTMHDLLLKTKNEKPILPSIIAPERYIPDRLEEICMRAISKDRNDRYPNVLELLHDIREFKYEATVSSIV